MIKQFLLLIATIAVVLAALLGSLYVLDLLKAADFQNDMRKLFGVMGIAAVAGVAIMLLMKAGQKK
jgi:hypothetical protein